MENSVSAGRMGQQSDAKQENGMRKAAKRKLRPMKILSDFEKEVKDIEEHDKWKKSQMME